MLRAEQTLDILYGGVDRTALPGLAEYRFGSFEMKSYEELKVQDDYQAWISDEAGDVSCPGGESKKQFEKRVVEEYERVLEKLMQGGGAGRPVGNVSVCTGGMLTPADNVGGCTGVVPTSASDTCGSAFVVCHGGTITYIMEHLAPGQKNYYEWQPKPGRGYMLSYISGQFTGYAAI